MIISTPGKIVENLYMLGPMGLPIYLVTGSKNAIFDAGVAFLGPLYADGIQQILLNHEPDYCFLTHSHFDHCGSVAVLKRHFPHLTILASQAAKNLFNRPNAIALMQQLNAAAAADAGSSAHPIHFEEFNVDQIVKEGDHMEIGPGWTVHVIETPGHTRDCISYYIADSKILIASEAMGIADQTGYIFSDFLVDYDMYFSSMEKLSRLDVEILCLGHYYVYTGEDAKRFFVDAMQHCKTFLHLVENVLLEEEGDIDRTVSRIKQVEYDPKPWPKQPEAAYLLNLRARIKVVRRRLGMES